MGPNSGDHFGTVQRFANEVVGARAESARWLVIPFEAGHDDHGGIPQGRPRADGAQNDVSVWIGHHQIDEHECRNLAREPLQRLAARTDADALDVRCTQRLT
jgi:hypothetical protein